MGMNIIVTVEEVIDEKLFVVKHRITDLELDYASFDLPCHVIKKLREQLEMEKQEYLRSQENALDA
jgi:hypothetical protein